jgi:hypothetical protein
VEWRSQEGWIGAHKRWRRQHSSFKIVAPSQSFQKQRYGMLVEQP